MPVCMPVFCCIALQGNATKDWHAEEFIQCIECRFDGTFCDSAHCSQMLADSSTLGKASCHLETQMNAIYFIYNACT